MINYYLLRVNPEPWAIGTIAAGRSKSGKTFGRMSPNPNLVAYQSAVREELENLHFPSYEEYRLKFWFWRNTARYLDPSDRVRSRNMADATNMQKGLEDALQGIVFDNDRRVKEIRSMVMAQGPDTVGQVVIAVEEFTQTNILEAVALFPSSIRTFLDKPPVPELSDQTWRGPQ